MLRVVSLLILPCVFLWAVPAYSAAPKPAWAKQGMVASADAMATQVGVEVLKRGGNAVDAAAAVCVALSVTEGYASGIGGGCFILIRLADGTTTAIDGRETAPGKATRLMFVPRDSTKPSDLSTAGVLSAATPGELAALDLAVHLHGTLSFGEILSGAIALADTGFDVDMRYARALSSNADLLKRFEGTRAIFFKLRGTELVPLEFGDRLVQKDLANTLRRVQSEGVAAFYRGVIPQTVESYMKANGGILAAKDFENYRPVEREPVRGEYRGMEVISMPPPSSGGIHVIQILDLLEPYDLNYFGAGSSESIHLIAEAMQLAFADRAAFLGDPDFVKVPVEGLLSHQYLDERRSRINRSAHERLEKAGDPWKFQPAGNRPHQSKRSVLPDDQHTTHLCVVDAAGNAVAITATVNTAFGSGVIVPGLGFFLNNQMDDFVTWPGRPNYFGLVGNEANEVAPGKRPLSSMAPTILVKDGKTVMVVGSMGGPRIITSVALTILNVFEFGMNLQEAVDFPRVHQQWVPDQLFVEPEYPFDVLQALRVRGHQPKSDKRWAAVTAILTDTTYGGWWGASDSRVGGKAAGY